ncbi:MAG: L-threonylcarbamoyladenylate synthase [Treponema sp.]|nr:L-threonylcarbamoyladenylate synthase [Treponema sp.]
MTCSKSFENITLVSSLLKKGEVVILPTDTVYGFSGIVDLKKSEIYKTDDKIRKIKGREESKPLIQLISSVEEIFKYTEIDLPSALLSKWPGSLTIIVPVKKDCVLNELVPTVAFRCPGDEWLRNVIAECGAPVYSTSVNRSGFPVLEKISEIKREFENEVSLIVEDGDKVCSLPSTLVLLNDDDSFKILRQGSVVL